MSKDDRRKWSLIAQFLVPVVTALGLVVPVYIFNAEQSNISQRELNSMYWKSQLEVYKETSRIIGEISAKARERKDIGNLYQKFNAINDGLMVVFADSALIESIKDVNEALGNYRKGRVNLIFEGILQDIYQDTTSSATLIEKIKYLNLQLGQSSKETWRGCNLPAEVKCREK